MSKDAKALVDDAREIMQGDNPDQKRAYKLLKAARKAGSVEAEYALGTWYLFSPEFVKKDVARGIRMIKNAAKGNHADALWDLAIFYERGKWVKVNKSKAFKYYLRAALYGEQDAVLEIARCYRYGIGVKKDRGLSEIWRERAETLGLVREPDRVQSLG